MKDIILIAALVAVPFGGARAQDWVDDFQDGSAVDGDPVMWTLSPAFGGAFDVVEGDLAVTMSKDAPFAISSPRVSINYPSGASVRARMIALNGPGRFTVAFADEPTGIQGYVASFSTTGGGRLELFRGDVLGSIVYLGGGPLPWHYLPTEEFIIQLDVRDDVISARVWRPGEPFPEPQIWDIDTTYSQGVPSIAIQDFGGGAGYLDAAAIVRYMHVSAEPLTHSAIGDIVPDGSVDVADLLQLLSSWGDCSGECPPACASDIAPFGGDCTVDVQDLLAVLGNWG